MSVPIADPRRGPGTGSGTGERQDWPASHWVFAPLRWVRTLWRALTTQTVDVTEAEAKMDRLIEDAEHGRPFAIAVDGKAVLKVSHMERDELDRLPKADD